MPEKLGFQFVRISLTGVLRIEASPISQVSGP